MKRQQKRRLPRRRSAASSYRRRSRVGRAESTSVHRLAQFEVLEERRVLSANALGANALASFEASLDNSAKMPELRLELTGGGSTNFVALRMSATNGGTIDPGEIEIRNNDNTVTPWVSLADVHGTTDSYLLVRLAPGEYPVFLQGDDGTGPFRVDVFLPGDLDDGMVTDQELRQASSSLVQTFGTNSNHISQLFFRQLNINLLQNQYNEAFDANMNGQIDHFDLDRLTFNLNNPLLMVSLTGELDPPEITIEMPNDTGIDEIDGSFEDGITNDDSDPIFEGTLKDANDVEFFRASIDSPFQNNFIDIMDLLEPASDDPIDGTDSVFSLTLDDLDRIFNPDGSGNATVLDSSPHTLRLVAGDLLGNSLGTDPTDDAEPFEFTFEIDTDYPQPPLTFDLTTESDSGILDDDDITQVVEPTIFVTVGAGQEGQAVRLTSTLDGFDPIGFGIVENGVAQITTSELRDGTHFITATAVDPAGNESNPANLFTLIIDNELSVLDLDTTVVSGVLGTLIGTTDPNSVVTLTLSGDDNVIDEVAAGDDGVFTFEEVSFPVALDPVDFTLSSVDPAGNERTSTPHTVTRNAPPVVDQQLESVVVDEDAVNYVDDVSNLFIDPDGVESFSLSVESGNSDLVEASLNGNMVTLDFQPDTFGTTNVTITATDNLGRMAEFVWAIQVDPVNDAPSFDISNELTVNEDHSGNESAVEPGFATNISPGGPVNDTFEVGQVLTFQIETDNNDLFAAGPEINSTTGDLTFTLAPDANGVAHVTVSLTDNGGTNNSGVDESVEQMFTITVNLVNDAPTFTLGDDQTIDEDTGQQTVETFAPDRKPGGGADEAGQGFSDFVVTTNNDALFSVLPAIDGDGTLTYTPADDAFGVAIVTVSLTDDGGTANGGVNTTEQTFSITINNVNDDPTAVDDLDLTVTVGIENDLNVLGNDLIAPDVGETLTIKEDPTADKGTVTRSNDNRLLLYTPNAGVQLGETDTFTYTIGDGNGGEDTATVTVTFVESSVNAVDDEFGIDPLIFEDNGPVSLDVLDNDEDPEGESFLIVSVSQGNQGGQVSHDGSMITYEPAPDFFGQETFTYTIEDTAGAMDTATVTVTVTGTNDAPEFDLPAEADQEITEGMTSLQTVASFASNMLPGGNPSDDPQSFTFELTNDNNGLFSVQPSIDSATGDLTYQLADDDVNGSAEVTVRLMDDGGTANGGVDESLGQTFTIEVTPVNDAPSFDVGDDELFLTDDAGPQTIPNHATNISPGGDGDEAGQTLQFIVITDNDALFSVLPAINAGGTLTFTPQVGANSSAEVTITLMDDGGTDNSGVDKSGEQHFHVTISTENDPPILVNPIADMDLNDVDENDPPNPGPQPDTIDLTNVFFDPDNDLAFEIVSNSNTDLVDVSINGDDLTVNYLPYKSDQDRTPADVTIRATEVGGDGLFVTDTFVVSVGPQTTFELYVVVLENASTQELDDDLTVSELPNSISEIGIGEDYVVEIYMRDLLGDPSQFPIDPLIAGEDFSQAIFGAFVDLTYVPSLVGALEGDDLTESKLFGSRPDDSPIIDVPGVIEQFGGLRAVNSDDDGIATTFSRLGVIEFTVSESGLQQFTLSLDDLDAPNPTTSVGRAGDLARIADDVHPSQVEIFNASVNHVSEIITLNINSAESELEVSGAFGGTDLEPQEAGISNTPQLSGTIQIEVDDLDAPSVMRIISANIDWHDTGNWKPNNDDPPNLPDTLEDQVDLAVLGEFQIRNVIGSDLPFNIAGRDWTSDLTSQLITLGPGGTFAANDWAWQLTGGEVDQHIGTNPASNIGGAEDDLTGVDLLPNATPNASLVRDNDTLTLTLPVTHHLTTEITGGTLSLDFIGLTNGIVATFTLPGAASTSSALAAPSNSAPVLSEEAVFSSLTSTTDAVILPPDETSKSESATQQELFQNGIAVDWPDMLIVDADHILRPAYFGEIGGNTTSDGAIDEVASSDLEADLTSIDAAFADWHDSLL